MDHMTETTSAHAKAVQAKPKGRLARALDSDLTASFFRSRIVVVAGIVALLMVMAAFLAPVIAPSNPYDLNGVNLLDASTPPVWAKGGESKFLLGSDNQGRDILSTMLYGTRS